MAERKYDVIVVGASFGGCVAGKVAAEKGLKTLVLERASVPGEKIVSGTGLPAIVFLELPWLMEAPLERPITGLITHFLKGGQVQTTVKVECPLPVAYGIYCRPFIAWMAEQATKAGAELMTSTVAIEAIKAEDTSAAFLQRYDELWKAHPAILPSITDWGRRNLLKAQQDESLMVKLAWEQWFSPIANFVPTLTQMRAEDLMRFLPKV